MLGSDGRTEHDPLWSGKPLITRSGPLLGEMTTIGRFVLERDEAEILYRAIQYHAFGQTREGLWAARIVRKLGDWLEAQE
jgi:hypothetical protein